MPVIKRSNIIDRGFVDFKQEAATSESISERQFENAQTPFAAPVPQEIAPPPRNQEAYEARQIEDQPDQISEEELTSQAMQIVEQAHTEAQEILAGANQEADSIKEAARNEGLEEGRQEAEEKTSSYVLEAFETLNSAIKERKKIIKDAEAEILRLSLKIAEQVIRSEVSLHKDVLLNIVSEAIGKVSDRENVVIKVNRDDIEHVKKFKDNIAGIVDGVRNLTIIEDSFVDPGGTVIETNLGYVDARISTKLELIEEALQKVGSNSDV